MALFTALAFILFWLFRGAHVGWTRSLETTMVLDPITELEFPVFTPVFLPGVDYLLFTALPAAIVAAVLAAIVRLKPVTEL
ncbi:MAG: hypothetical protein LR015_01755 [Verrucomicrobia bacterium]|nr:hypothetical protein [Verrucomicrobiota bacterium]